jgi:hypothetical protein
MLKHHRSTLFDFLPILKHQSSAVLHLQQLFRSSLLLKHPSFTIVRQQDFTTSDYSSTIKTANPRHNQNSPPQQDTTDGHHMFAERIKW